MPRLLYRFSDYCIDPSAREITRVGELQAVSPQVFDCIAYLIEHRERAVGRDELISAVWGRAEIKAGTRRRRPRPWHVPGERLRLQQRCEPQHCGRAREFHGGVRRHLRGRFRRTLRRLPAGPRRRSGGAAFFYAEIASRSLR
jgi:hypothetical protein